MILCAPIQLRPGMVTGIGVPDPADPGAVLVAANIELTAEIIAALIRRDARRVWVRHPDTESLDPAGASDLSAFMIASAVALRDGLQRTGEGTVATAGVQSVRALAMEMITEVMAKRSYAGIVGRIESGTVPFYTHAANVAFLSVLIGLELETYVVRERPRLDVGDARDLTSLAMGALFHDIGKLSQGPDVQDWHEVDHADAEPGAYRLHPEAGRRMLAWSRAPATAVQIVLLHHQCFNGAGWPPVSRLGFDEPRPLQRDEIHIFARIVGVANALDNLLARADASDTAPARVLAGFAARMNDGRFDPVVHAGALRAVAPFPVGARATLTDGAECVITRLNRLDPCRPVVQPLLDDALAEPIDLSEGDLEIASCLGQPVTGVRYRVPPADPDGQLRAA